MKTIRQLRQETPGVLHAIHLNNAGASLQPMPVIQSIRHYMEVEAQTGGYEVAQIFAKEIMRYYRTLGLFLNADARNIAFSTNATDAFNKALSSVPLKAGDVILTTRNDYVSNQIAFLHLQKTRGINLVRAEDLPEGGVDPDSVRDLVRKHQPKLLAVTHMPTSSGLIQDIESIGQICREYQTWYLVDACQSAGQIPLDVQKIQCDFLSATMRKFMRGPRGAGFLFVSDRALEAGLEPSYPDLHGATWTGADSYELNQTAKRFEYWERNYSLMLGSQAAVEYAMDQGMDAIWTSVHQISRILREKLKGVEGVQIMDKGAHLGGIVTIYMDRISGKELFQYLSKNRIHSSLAGVHNALLDFQEKQIDWLLRLSAHYYNTEEELDDLIICLEDFMRISN